MVRPGKQTPRGRPRQRRQNHQWDNRAGGDIKLLEIKDGKQLAKDREILRGLVKGAMGLQ